MDWLEIFSLMISQRINAAESRDQCEREFRGRWSLAAVPGAPSGGVVVKSVAEIRE